jgi:predicted nucleic acid-binding protein
MILYLDTSALVKRYVAEAGTNTLGMAIEAADVVGTSIVSYVEMAAALARAVRLEVVEGEAAREAYRIFRSEWPNLVRVQVTQGLVQRAGSLAREHELRGYDAVQLASGLLWQDGLQAQVTFATYDRSLWAAANEVGMKAFPKDLLN